MARNNVNSEFSSPNKFIELFDVTPHNYVGDAGFIYRVNALETGLEPINPNAIIPPLIPPVVGAGLQNHIPIWNDPLGIPPVFIDSGISVAQISLGPTTGTVIDFEPVANPQSHLIGVIDNTPTNIFAMACNSQSTPTADRDLIITNNSVGAQDMLFANNSGGGIGSNNFIGGAETTTISDSLSNNYIQINPTTISLTDTIDNNYININSSGITSVVLGAGQSNIIAADGLAVLQSYNNKVIVKELTNNNILQCSANGVSIATSPANNKIDVSSANNNVTINSATDIIINTSYNLPTVGNSLDQVCIISNTNQMSFVDSSTLNIPVSIPMKRIEGLGQIIAPSTSALMEGVQQYSSGSIPDWTTNNTLGGTVDGLIEANLTFTSQFGTSQNFTMQPIFNGIAFTTGLSQIMNGVSSYSNIYNVAVTDTLSFEITNNDAVLNVVISEFILTFKKIQQYNP